MAHELIMRAYSVPSCMPLRLRCKHVNSAMFCVADFEANAKQSLDKNAWDYYSSGAIHGETVRDNVEAYSRSLRGKLEFLGLWPGS